MQVEQFVMAYLADQDRIRALLPSGFESLRPVLRINAEITHSGAYLEFNTPATAMGKRGWLNIGFWNGAEYKKEGKSTSFHTPFLDISFLRVGISGGCPAEKDNDGCFFPYSRKSFRPAEKITENKEFCDCEFKWKFSPHDAFGKSEGATFPAFYTEPQTVCEKLPLTAQNAAAIACIKVLGSYAVIFER